MSLLLEIENLSLGFEICDRFYLAAKNLSYKLNCGQMLAIIGESGSGKSVSVMSIMGLLPKNARIIEGKIFYKGVDLLKLKECELNKIRGAKIALIPQDPMTSLNPLYTIENQMVEAILAHNQYSKKEAVELALKSLHEVNIEDAENKIKSYPHELSGGLKQRVIIAIALSLNPDIIIADEPTTALDVTVQAQILDLLSNIKSKGKSIILISHDLGVVKKYADFISIMYSGRIVESAPVNILFDNPKHPYTKALMKALPYSNEKRLKNIKGAPPPITEEISGCEFHKRCDFAQEICKDKIFHLVKQNDCSSVACLYYNNKPLQ